MVFFFKQKTAYEMRISDWSSDVCSFDLQSRHRIPHQRYQVIRPSTATPPSATPMKVTTRIGSCSGSAARLRRPRIGLSATGSGRLMMGDTTSGDRAGGRVRRARSAPLRGSAAKDRSEEHTSEHKSLMRTSYAVFCLQQKH